jgi:hypothetical protein
MAIDAYLQIDGIKGESQDSAHQGWIELGPDLPQTCSGEQGDRLRDKKGIHCSYTAEDKETKEGPYRCWIGLDLRTGESVGTVSC